ncbi:hypothetical protein PAESOLCIP111_04839 [Paenibacillus solanacearum]|uniref:Uncharacterized protein n=1 Tax=Paenibacillus solanacearum TaxID=2048548 RepID=A0A916K8J2_9BACL|nr:hypothetical protein [Paenibacillus solanacearum]CAG7644894.1 hypothetical protein PAESOLCIP111_04839 [Paenibacillus solanacearum]
MNRQLWAALEDVHLHSRLANIAKRHVKLVLEFGEGSTPITRREAIKDEIQQLRHERDTLIESTASSLSNSK